MSANDVSYVQSSSFYPLNFRVQTAVMFQLSRILLKHLSVLNHPVSRYTRRRCRFMQSGATPDLGAMTRLLRLQVDHKLQMRKY